MAKNETIIQTNETITVEENDIRELAKSYLTYKIGKWDFVI